MIGCYLSRKMDVWKVLYMVCSKIVSKQYRVIVVGEIGHRNGCLVASKYNNLTTNKIIDKLPYYSVCYLLSKVKIFFLLLNSVY